MKHTQDSQVSIINDYSEWCDETIEAEKTTKVVNSERRVTGGLDDEPWDLSLIEGDSDVHDQVRQMVEDLDAWRRGELAWSDMTASMIIEGEPGTGKTFLASQIAKCIGENRSIITSYAEWQGSKDGHLGNFLAAMKNSFNEAIESKPSFLFIDEIDSFGSRSTGGDSNSGYHRKAVNGFLAQMDMNRLEGVIVIGACNDISGMDHAILRDGRFDEHLRMELPGPGAIAKMIEGPLEGIVDADHIMEISRVLTGTTPADIQGAIRKMKSECRRKKVTFCPDELVRRILPPADLRESIWRRVSLHECGHAIVCKALGLGEVKRVLMRSDGSGYAISRPSINEYLIEDLDANIAHLMAGRAAEELFLGNSSGGAGGSARSDIARANQIALSIEVKLGLGGQGHLYFDLKDAEWHRDKEIKSRVKSRIRDGLQQSRAILERYKSVLDEMARDLVKERILSGERLNHWLSRVGDKEPFSTHGMTPDILINKLKDCKIRFRNAEITADARSASRSVGLVLIPLLRIGWKYGQKRTMPDGAPDLMTACAEGLDSISTSLPEHSIIPVRKLLDFSNHLSVGPDFSMIENLIDSGKATRELSEIARLAQLQINIESISQGAD
ncbi:AAA family ATPase [Pseudosulfitobacter pseudonitzschiae]|uniref:AAA family ATPase n=1 Tax=Pseudosulfitobacter pseudonitzschiae TaxID=1402135 RepID=UPI003B82885D